ncbi:LON peptidase substrate-binding domain-containing protein [Candidatus Poribacteria bacterium]|nr:LON peptidase substrate-binding domain-containing protein [Candidatus Poribacteria bacterium]
MSLFAIPLFPLPGLVLFPRTLMPLHIFEPRYVRMVREAIEGDHRIATAQLRKGWQKNYFGTPPVFRTITAARILHDERTPTGQYNIILEGIERAWLLDELESKPDRVVKARSLVDAMPEGELVEILEAQRETVRLSSLLVALKPEFKAPLSNLENAHLHPGIIADQVAALIVRDPYERQSLLEQLGVLRRLKLVNVQLHRVLDRARRSSRHPAPDPG